MIFTAIALFSCGTFFGAAIYISIAQHPASIEAGTPVGGRFFPPMYSRAAPMQIFLAIAGFVSGILAWYDNGSLLWIVGAIFLISVVPITLILIKPINDVLLNPENDPESDDTHNLLLKWGPKHWLRTLASGVSFVLYIIATLA